MIDTLVELLPRAHKPIIFNNFKQYILTTLHRPSNVDEPESLRSIIQNLNEISNSIPVLFPVHPRTKNMITINNLDFEKNDNLHLIDPLGYLDFLGLMKNSTAVITDSGGIQEETTYLGIPCITVRENTERPITITLGTNQLIGKEYHKIPVLINNMINGKKLKRTSTPLVGWKSF